MCLQRGPNKVPVFALIVITLIALLFVFIGKVNTLGPIVTMPFMLTYAAVDYAYFVLAMSYDQKQKRYERLEGGQTQRLQNGSAAGGAAAAACYGAIPAINRKSDDLDTLFPERTRYDQHLNGGSPSKKQQQKLPASTTKQCEAVQNSG